MQILVAVPLLLETLLVLAAVWGASLVAFALVLELIKSAASYALHRRAAVTTRREAAARDGGPLQLPTA